MTLFDLSFILGLIAMVDRVDILHTDLQLRLT